MLFIFILYLPTTRDIIFTSLLLLSSCFLCNISHLPTCSFPFSLYSLSFFLFFFKKLKTFKKQCNHSYLSPSSAITCCCYVTTKFKKKKNQCLPLHLITHMCPNAIDSYYTAKNKIIDTQKEKEKKNFIMVTWIMRVNSE